MSRIKFNLPNNKVFQMSGFIRIDHINYGDHLGHDKILTICHEARMQFLKKHHWSETDIEGISLIMSDAAIMFRSEAFYGDPYSLDIFIADIGATGFNLYYSLINSQTGQEIARVKTGLRFFDYKVRKIVHTPKEFSGLFQVKDANN